MHKIINFKWLLRFVALATTFASIGIYELVRGFWDEELPLVKVLSIAPWVTLIIIIAITTNWIARKIWTGLRLIDRSLYPDLNGTWEGEIVTEKDLKIPVKAIIRQTLLFTEIDIHTKTSKSQTLESTPQVECGQAKLYYVYRSIPKDPNWSTYTGSTVFDIRTVGSALELSGYYFTNRKTNGRIRLGQISGKVESDVSYY